MSVRVPLAILHLPRQKYSCHGCGDCCRDFTVQLRPKDIERLESQGYARDLGEPVTIEFRGAHYLRQKSDGACFFLEDDGRCRIHADYGFDEKPVACRLFPFNLAPDARGPSAGLNFACQSVQRNAGAGLGTHAKDLKRALRELPEVETRMPPRLSGRLRADTEEINAITSGIDSWLTSEVPPHVRWDGLGWLAQSFSAAKLDQVRGARFKELVNVLTSALPEELDHLPIADAGLGQRRLLRQAVFARIEDPRIHDGARRNSMLVRLEQWRRSRRWTSGKGIPEGLPRGWEVADSFASVNEIVFPEDQSVWEEIDDLITRWLRSTVLGGRCWGAGCYGFSVVEGLQALVLNLACVGWLARLHAAGRGLTSVDLEAVRASLGRIDRAAGRAKWLGSGAEKMRLKFFANDDGLRRIIAHAW